MPATTRSQSKSRTKNSNNKMDNDNNKRGSNSSFLSMDESLPGEQLLRQQQVRPVKKEGGGGGGGQLALGAGTSNTKHPVGAGNSNTGHPVGSGTSATVYRDNNNISIVDHNFSLDRFDRRPGGFDHRREAEIIRRMGDMEGERHVRPRLRTRVKAWLKEQWALIVRNRIFTVQCFQLLLMLVNTCIFLYTISTYGG